MQGLLSKCWHVTSCNGSLSCGVAFVRLGKWRKVIAPILSLYYSPPPSPTQPLVPCINALIAGSGNTPTSLSNQSRIYCWNLRVYNKEPEKSSGAKTITLFVIRSSCASGCFFVFVYFSLSYPAVSSHVFVPGLGTPYLPNVCLCYLSCKKKLVLCPNSIA